MSSIFFAAAFVATVAPLMRARAWRIPFGWLSRATVVRAIIGGFLTTTVAGLLLRLALRDVNTTADAIDVTAALGAAMFGMALTLSAVIRDRRLRGLHIALERLADRDVSDAALIRVVRVLTEARGRVEHSRLTLYAASHLMRHDRHDVAMTHLSALDPQTLDSETAAVRGQTLATCALQMGALEDAAAALAEVERPASAALEPWLVATSAWIHVIAGGADRALELVGNEPDGRPQAARTGKHAPDRPKQLEESEEHPEQDASLQLTNVRRSIRAHAYASRGDDTRARTLLRLVMADLGAVGLAPALRPVGPATDIARELLASMASASLHEQGGAMNDGPESAGSSEDSAADAEQGPLPDSANSPDSSDSW